MSRAVVVAAILAAHLVASLWLPPEHLAGYWDGTRVAWKLLAAAAVIMGITVVMGSFISALVLAFPIYLGFKHFVIAYRKTIGARVEKMKVYQVVKHSSLVQWYMKLRDLGN